MNQIQAILLELQQLDIKLWVEQGRLLYDAPKELMTPKIISQIKQHKTEIISFLQDKSASEMQSIPAVSRNQQLPLSFAQERLWFIEQFEGANSIYNLRRILKLKGQLNISALEKAIIFLWQRHESLRTNFLTQQGKPYLKIKSQLNFSLPVINLEHLDQTSQELEVEKIFEQQNQIIFDLENDLLVKWTLVKLKPEEHILIILMHHIITDGWSMGILTRELSQLYQLYNKNTVPKLTPLPIQYADFAIWQRQYFPTKIFTSQLNYWRNTLADIPPNLSLPFKQLRPQIQTFQGATQIIILSTEITKQLKILSQEYNVTLFILLLTVLSILLSRYSNQKDVIIGSPIANRNRQDIEAIIGFFVNTLPLRINVASNLTFIELLKQVKKTALDAYEHQDLPFEKLVEELNPERNLSHHPIFQVMFALQNVPDISLKLEGLEVELVPTKTKKAKFDLSLFVIEKEKQLQCKWEYNTDLFAADTIRGMSNHWQNLLTAIVSNPQQQISLLPLLSQEEEQQILVEWNQTQEDYPQALCLHQLFEAQAIKTPDAVAIVFKQQQLTYQQLNQKANQLAHYLRTLSVKPETKVGICIERSLEMIIGMLAILKAGGAYVPLEPNSPPERLNFILKDAALNILLTQKSLLNQLSSLVTNLIYLDQDNLFTSQAKTNPSSEIQSHNLIYIIYTSGSTGKPKGVEITHANLVNVLNSISNRLEITAQERFLSLASFAFDISVAEIFLPLINGGQLIISSEGVSKDAEQLAQLISQSQATIVDATPATWKLLQTINWLGKENLKIISTGEKLAPELGNYLLDRHKLVWNIYGPTEVTIWSLIEQLRKGEKVSIGKPLGNIQAYILDPALNPVPIGVLGELHLAGEGLARGYLNRPQLTAEKFIPNPFGAGRLYKTGDLARYLADGRIEFLGRIDNQVKIRGFRIELAEIEANLTKNSQVTQSFVITSENELGEQYLVAYIVSNGQSKPDSQELRQFLKAKLPEYMIPSVYVFLDSFPLTANGKIDPKALPEPNWQSNQTQVFTAPRNATEIKLAQIWQEVLGIEKIGINDNFFELGGHSLLATQIVSRIRHRFEVNLPLSYLFEFPTVKQLGQYLAQLANLKPDNFLIFDEDIEEIEL